MFAFSSCLGGMCSPESGSWNFPSDIAQGADKYDTIYENRSLMQGNQARFHDSERATPRNEGRILGATGAPLLIDRQVKWL